MENIVLLKKDDLKILREEITDALNCRLNDFKKNFIYKINETVNNSISLYNEETIQKSTLYIKVFLDKPNDKKFKLADLFLKIKESGKQIEEESDIINQLSIEIKDPKYKGKNLFNGDELNEDIGKELDELIFIVEIELSL